MFLQRVARVWAASRGRDYVLPDDVKELAPAVLSHRMALRPEAVIRGVTLAEIVGATLNDLRVPGTADKPPTA